MVAIAQSSRLKKKKEACEKQQKLDEQKLDHSIPPGRKTATGQDFAFYINSSITPNNLIR